MVSRKKSLIWNHFTALERGKAKCGFCNNVLSYRGGSTTNLARHLRLKHPTVAFRLQRTPVSKYQQEVHAEATNEPIILQEGQCHDLGEVIYDGGGDETLHTITEVTEVQVDGITCEVVDENLGITVTAHKEKENSEDIHSAQIMEIYSVCLNKTDGDAAETFNSEEKILLQPFDHLLQVPGKKIRSKLTKAFNHWLDIPSDKCTAIGEIIEMLHNASLLIDDIEDSSLLRRGIPVAHHIFGIPTTINSANYVYFLSLQKVLELGHSEATKIFTNHLLELHRGQGMEIYWRDNFVCPSEEEYKQMVMRKTGGLIGLAVGLMQLFSENKSDFTTLIGIIGLYFQIRDDYANLRSKEYTENKSYCEDLTEGKFSFPIIHAIRYHSENPQIFNIIRQRTKSVEIKKYAVDLLEKLGSFEYTRTCLLDLDQQAREEINSLGENRHMIAVLDELKNW